MSIYIHVWICRSRPPPHEKVFGVEAINGKHKAVIPALQLDWRDVNYNHLFLPVLILICARCVWPNFVLMKLAFSVKFRGLECSAGDNFLVYPARPTLPIQYQRFDCVLNDFHPLFFSPVSNGNSSSADVHIIITPSNIWANKHRLVHDVCDYGANLQPKSLKGLIVINNQ